MMRGARSVHGSSIVEGLIAVSGGPVDLRTTDEVSPTTASWILLALAVGRTVADYSTSWNFYFPNA